MVRWKWFQRQDEPVDVVQRPAYAHRGGAYGTHGPQASTDDRPTDRPGDGRAGHGTGHSRSAS
ncbi:hypothetical protein [Micromonospora sp. AKA38]|uniref:hypothetical protein n=1 Tax=Micromonospora sp. AKA38 TaxID=2733861 RepID=UPI0022C16F37|nr:hypothetical protein [Micromonospora sp. AKA38]GHJ15721.1 hypothetical protein TPA0908_37160 [Micromonospora sp. AKA38]